ncbi:hypothetical protein PVAP13_3KG261886 [Panicum virgatum]|uniref:Uncharacterized protein n=1 Tax=Panicum virgatum TaxID=38727 RepID=A0A8T0V6M2_PANVG|nr:hypothetical protein PVAP13_3KG261886 [Panicum virgatum]
MATSLLSPPVTPVLRPSRRRRTGLARQDPTRRAPARPPPGLEAAARPNQRRGGARCGRAGIIDGAAALDAAGRAGPGRIGSGDSELGDEAGIGGELGMEAGGENERHAVEAATKGEEEGCRRRRAVGGRCGGRWWAVGGGEADGLGPLVSGRRVGQPLASDSGGGAGGRGVARGGEAALPPRLLPLSASRLLVHLLLRRPVRLSPRCAAPSPVPSTGEPPPIAPPAPSTDEPLSTPHRPSSAPSASEPLSMPPCPSPAPSADEPLSTPHHPLPFSLRQRPALPSHRPDPHAAAQVRRDVACPACLSSADPSPHGGGTSRGTTSSSAALAYAAAKVEQDLSFLATTASAGQQRPSQAPRHIHRAPRFCSIWRMGSVDAKSGHTLERARTCSKIVKTINTSSLPVPTSETGIADRSDRYSRKTAKT